MIVIVASTASAGPQLACAPISATSKKRRNTPSAATFVATAMNAVTGVGAPSYTSGVHWWNGATEALKHRPATHSAIPVSVSGSLARLPFERAFAISLKSVAPVAP